LRASVRRRWRRRRRWPCPKIGRAPSICFERGSADLSTRLCEWRGPVSEPCHRMHDATWVETCFCHGLMAAMWLLGPGVECCHVLCRSSLKTHIARPQGRAVARGHVRDWLRPKMANTFTGAPKWLGEFPAARTKVPLCDNIGIHGTAHHKSTRDFAPRRTLYKRFKVAWCALSELDRYDSERGQDGHCKKLCDYYYFTHISTLPRGRNVAIYYKAMR
jgi:hypothetical protein